MAKMWPIIWAASLCIFLSTGVQAAVLHSSGFQPSLGIGLDYNPASHQTNGIGGYDSDKDACALVLDGPGKSSLYDHTHSIFFGIG